MYSSSTEPACRCACADGSLRCLPETETKSKEAPIALRGRSRGRVCTVFRRAADAHDVPKFLVQILEWLRDEFTRVGVDRPLMR
jgi:hypothetical protein